MPASLEPRPTPAPSEPARSIRPLRSYYRTQSDARTGRPSWEDEVNSRTKLVITIIAVIAVAIVAYFLLYSGGGSSGGGGGGY